jgi:ADP-ribosylglycohydrolase
VAQHKNERLPAVPRRLYFHGLHRVIAFLESAGFEDAIRNAISLGGDSDTLAAITGSIAEAAYGIPDWIRDKALGLLDAPLREVYERWRDFEKSSSRQ